MVYRKRKRSVDYERLLSLARDMSGEQRVIQDIIDKFVKKGASVRNGELIRNLPQQFVNVPIGEFNGVMYFWNGRYYEPMSRNMFNDYVYRFMCSCNVQAEAFNVLQLIQDKCYDAAMCHKIKLQPYKFVFMNGVMDLSEKKFVKGFTPDDVQINAVDYDYCACEPVVWKSFLNQVLPDQASQNTLQMFLGATLMPRSEAKIEKMLVLYGSGSNGKSVVFETVKGVLGENSVSYFGISDFVNENERGQSVTGCNGRRLNYCSEIRAFLGKDICDDTLKEIISGEPMTVRPKYGAQNVVVKDLPLLMANTNWNMEAMDMSPALRRRIVQLCFNVNISSDKQDRTLHRRLHEEYAGIFSWIVEGLDKLRGNEYKFPDEDKLPVPKEEYAERKKLDGDLWDVIIAFLNYNRYNFKCYGTRTSKFNMRLTHFMSELEEFVEANGYILVGRVTTKTIAEHITKHGGVITKSGGSRYVVLWATAESVKRFRALKKAEKEQTDK